MHLRNPYQHPIDFVQLSDQFPELRSKLKTRLDGSTTIDFKDVESQRLLTQCLLKRDSNLSLVLPENRLCPPIPNRINYLLWLQDILSDITIDQGRPPEKKIEVLDIGTGASCIYPLLGCALDSNWNFIATEIDPISYRYALQNIATNQLTDRIRLMKIEPGEPIFKPLLERMEDTIVDLTMCNPPFYDSVEEMQALAAQKELEPFAIFTGSENEMITSGGEVHFVSQMIEESIRIAQRCRWFTSMIGKASSLNPLITILRERNITNYAITKFVQGSTRRWGIGWSFREQRLRDSNARFLSSTLQNLMPPPNEFKYAYEHQDISKTSLARIISEVINSIDVAKVDIQNSSDGLPVWLVHSHGDSWSRAARRRKKQSSVSTDQLLSMSVKLGLSLNGEIHGRWLLGTDRVLWESFWSHLVRKVADRIRGIYAK